MVKHTQTIRRQIGLRAPSKTENFKKQLFPGSRCSYSNKMKGECVFEILFLNEI